MVYSLPIAEAQPRLTVVSLWGHNIRWMEAYSAGGTRLGPVLFPSLSFSFPFLPPFPLSFSSLFLCLLQLNLFSLFSFPPPSSSPLSPLHLHLIGNQGSPRNFVLLYESTHGKFKLIFFVRQPVAFLRARICLRPLHQ